MSATNACPFSIFDGGSAQRPPGWWIDRDTPTIYVCQHYSTASFE
nr:hypothetical protein [Abyssibacter sp.]